MLGSAVKTSVGDWQRSLLPLMDTVLVVAAIFFAWQSVYEFADLKTHISSPKVDLSKIFDQFEQTGAGNEALANTICWLSTFAVVGISIFQNMTRDGH